MSDDLLGHTSEPRVIRNYRANELDYNYIRAVFPEHGLVTTIAGALLRKFANELHALNLSTYDDRITLNCLDAKELLKNVKITITLPTTTHEQVPNQ